MLRRDGERHIALRIDGNDHELGGWIFDDYERLAEIRFGFVPEHYMVCISKEYIERLMECSRWFKAETNRYRDQEKEIHHAESRMVSLAGVQVET